MASKIQKIAISFILAFSLPFAAIAATAQEHFDKGVHYFVKEGKAAEALKEFDAAIKLKRDFADAYNFKGLVLVSLNKHEEALVAHNLAIKHQPDIADFYMAKAAVLRHLAKDEQALEACNAAIKRSLKLPEVYFSKGMILQRLNRLEEAIDAYNEAIKLDPEWKSYAVNYQKTEWSNVYLRLGTALGKLKRHSEALKAFDRAIDIKFVEKPAITYVLKGYTLFFLGKPQEAVKLCAAAIEYNPTYAEAYYCVGQGLQKLGHTAEAQKAFTIAKNLESTLLLPQ